MIQMTPEVAEQIDKADVGYRIPPGKVQSFIDKAERLGLTVTREMDSGNQRFWLIGTPNPVDCTQVWLFYTPSNRGGRLSITVYYGPYDSKPKRDVTRAWAFIALDSMGDSLKRHQELEANKFAEEVDRIANRYTAADIEAGLSELAGRNDAAAIWATAVRTEALRRVRNDEELSALKIKLADCGCPLDLIADCGHQEGCTVRQEEIQRAEHFQLTVDQLRAASDPSRPGWFLVGQCITDHVSRVHHQVVNIEHDKAGKVARVAVSTNGGYGGKLHWYGDHPEAVAGLEALEGPHVGLAGSDRRPWPRGLAAAHTVIQNVLTAQRLSGWAAGKLDPDRIEVNLPNRVDPTRHLILLERYVPYQAVVRLVPPWPRNRDAYPVITITPRED